MAQGCTDKEMEIIAVDILAKAKKRANTSGDDDGHLLASVIQSIKQHSERLVDIIKDQLTSNKGHVKIKFNLSHMDDYLTQCCRQRNIELTDLEEIENDDDNHNNHINDAHVGVIRKFSSVLTQDLRIAGTLVLDNLVQSEALSEIGRQSIIKRKKSHSVNSAFLKYCNGLSCTMFKKKVLPALRDSNDDVNMKLANEIQKEIATISMCANDHSLCISCKIRNTVNYRRIADHLYEINVIADNLREDLSSSHLPNDRKWRQLMKVKNQKYLILALKEKYPDLYNERQLTPQNIMTCTCFVDTDDDEETEMLIISDVARMSDIASTTSTTSSRLTAAGGTERTSDSSNRAIKTSEIRPGRDEKTSDVSTSSSIAVTEDLRTTTTSLSPAGHSGKMADTVTTTSSTSLVYNGHIPTASDTTSKPYQRSSFAGGVTGTYASSSTGNITSSTVSISDFERNHAKEMSETTKTGTGGPIVKTSDTINATRSTSRSVTCAHMRYKSSTTSREDILASSSDTTSTSVSDRVHATCGRASFSNTNTSSIAGGSEKTSHAFSTSGKISSRIADQVQKKSYIRSKPDTSSSSIAGSSCETSRVVSSTGVRQVDKSDTTTTSIFDRSGKTTDTVNTSVASSVGGTSYSSSRKSTSSNTTGRDRRDKRYKSSPIIVDHLLYEKSETTTIAGNAAMTSEVQSKTIPISSRTDVRSEETSDVVHTTGTTSSSDTGYVEKTSMTSSTTHHTSSRTTETTSSSKGSRPGKTSDERSNYSKSPSSTNRHVSGEYMVRSRLDDPVLSTPDTMSSRIAGVNGTYVSPSAIMTTSFIATTTGYSEKTPDTLSTINETSRIAHHGVKIPEATRAANNTSQCPGARTQKKSDTISTPSSTLRVAGQCKKTVNVMHYKPDCDDLCCTPATTSPSIISRANGVSPTANITYTGPAIRGCRLYSSSPSISDDNLFGTADPSTREAGQATSGNYDTGNKSSSSLAAGFGKTPDSLNSTNESSSIAHHVEKKPETTRASNTFSSSTSAHIEKTSDTSNTSSTSPNVAGQSRKTHMHYRSNHTSCDDIEPNTSDPSTSIAIRVKEMSGKANMNKTAPQDAGGGSEKTSDTVSTTSKISRISGSAEAMVDIKLKTNTYLSSAGVPSGNRSDTLTTAGTISSIAGHVQNTSEFTDAYAEASRLMSSTNTGHVEKTEAISSTNSGGFKRTSEKLSAVIETSISSDVSTYFGRTLSSANQNITSSRSTGRDRRRDKRYKSSPILDGNLLCGKNETRSTTIAGSDAMMSEVQSKTKNVPSRTGVRSEKTSDVVHTTGTTPSSNTGHVEKKSTAPSTTNTTSSSSGSCAVKTSDKRSKDSKSSPSNYRHVSDEFTIGSRWNDHVLSTHQYHTRSMPIAGGVDLPSVSMTASSTASTVTVTHSGKPQTAVNGSSAMSSIAGHVNKTSEFTDAYADASRVLSSTNHGHIEKIGATSSTNSGGFKRTSDTLSTVIETSISPDVSTNFGRTYSSASQNSTSPRSTGRDRRDKRYKSSPILDGNLLYDKNETRSSTIAGNDAMMSEVQSKTIKGPSRTDERSEKTSGIVHTTGTTSSSNTGHVEKKSTTSSTTDITSSSSGSRVVRTSDKRSKDNNSSTSTYRHVSEEHTIGSRWNDHVLSTHRYHTTSTPIAGGVDLSSVSMTTSSIASTVTVTHSEKPQVAVNGKTSETGNPTIETSSSPAARVEGTSYPSSPNCTPPCSTGRNRRKDIRYKSSPTTFEINAARSATIADDFAKLSDVKSKTNTTSLSGGARSENTGTTSSDNFCHMKDTFTTGSRAGKTLEERNSARKSSPSTYRHVLEENMVG